MKRLILAVLCVAGAVAPLLAQAQAEQAQAEQAQAGTDSLANLIQRGDRKAALAKIQAGADVNQAQPDGTRPIHWAVYRVDYDLLAALIARKVDVNVKNAFGAAPIAEAAELGDARMVKMLLDAGAGPEGANADGQTALMLAIQAGSVPVVQMLINAGANVNAIEQFHHQTPLMWAAANENGAEMVKLLLAKGADTKVRALYSDWASQISSEPRAQYRPTGGLTALLYAARSGCYGCVEELLDAGADPNVPTPEGVTPMMIAIDNLHNGIAKLLLDRGANPKVWDWWGRTALYIATDCNSAYASCGKDALGGGRGGRGAAPAASRGPGPAVSNVELITALLDAGVDPNPQLNMHRPSRGGNSGRFIDPFLNTGCTPLLRAAMGNDIEVARLLLDHGANPNIVAMGLTPFLIAAGVGTGGRGTGLAAQTSSARAADFELTDMLLAHGANINAQITGTLTYSMRISRSPSANEGMTALHSAAQRGSLELVRYLLDHGANPKLKDAEGRMPIDLVGGGARGGALPPPPAAAGGRGGRGGRGGPSPDDIAEIRTLLENAAAKN